MGFEKRKHLRNSLNYKLLSLVVLMHGNASRKELYDAFQISCLIELATKNTLLYDCYSSRSLCSCHNLSNPLAHGASKKLVI